MAAKTKASASIKKTKVSNQLGKEKVGDKLGKDKPQTLTRTATQMKGAGKMPAGMRQKRIRVTRSA